MRHRFASFTWAALVAATLVTDASGQEPVASGQTLVSSAARQVAAEVAVSAEMRYRIDAFGHQLVGTGNYLQYGQGPEKLVRLDLRMQVGDKVATVQEIRGEESYWVRRDVPPAAPTLGRVDLRQLRKSITQSNSLGEADVLPQGDWIMLGGLARVLSALEANFQFGEPRSDEVKFMAADGKSEVRLPIWVTSGQWKPERLEALTARAHGKKGALPEQLPDRVEVVLGRTEDVLPLFPFRITYWRTTATDKSAKEQAQPRELLTLELFNVSRKRIDPLEFQYQPGDQDVQNLTPFYVQRLNGDTKVR